MLSNLFVSNTNATAPHVSALATYLQSLRDNPSSFAKLLVLLFIAILVLGFWAYSIVMSTGAMTSLRSAAGASETVTAPLRDTTESDITAPATAPGASVDSSSSDNIDLKINSNSSNNSTQTDVQVNGQSIPVPTDGSTHQVIQDDNGKTTVDIDVDSDNSGSSSVRSSTNINLKSSSNIDVDIESKESQ